MITVQDLHDKWREAVEIATDGRMGGLIGAHYRNLDLNTFIKNTTRLVEANNLLYSENNILGRMIAAHRHALIYREALHNGLNRAMILKLSMTSSED